MQSMLFIDIPQHKYFTLSFCKRVTAQSWAKKQYTRFSHIVQGRNFPREEAENVFKPNRLNPVPKGTVRVGIPIRVFHEFINLDWDCEET